MEAMPLATMHLMRSEDWSPVTGLAATFGINRFLMAWLAETVAKEMRDRDLTAIRAELQCEHKGLLS